MEKAREETGELDVELRNLNNSDPMKLKRRRTRAFDTPYPRKSELLRDKINYGREDFFLQRDAL